MFGRPRLRKGSLIREIADNILPYFTYKELKELRNELYDFMEAKSNKRPVKR